MTRSFLSHIFDTTLLLFGLFIFGLTIESSAESRSYDPVGNTSDVNSSATSPALAVVVPPENQLQREGGRAAFGVVVQGPSDLQIEWEKDSRPIVGAHDPYLVIPSVKKSDSGSYAVHLTHGDQSVRSSSATLKLDNDADLLPDEWEYQHFGKLAGFSALTDSDGDGISNRQEFLDGTTPNQGEATVATLQIERYQGRAGTVTVDPLLPTYPPGTPVTVTATPNEGDEFYGWDGAEKSTERSITVIVFGAKKLTAYFGKNLADHLNIHTGTIKTGADEGFWYPDFDTDKLPVLKLLPILNNRSGWVSVTLPSPYPGPMSATYQVLGATFTDPAATPDTIDLVRNEGATYPYGGTGVVTTELPAGTQTLRWIVAHGDPGRLADTRIPFTLGRVAITYTPSVSLDEVLDSNDLHFTTGGDLLWYGVPYAKQDLYTLDSARSGPLLSNQQSWIETTVNIAVPSQLDFTWHSGEAGPYWRKGPIPYTTEFFDNGVIKKTLDYEANRFDSFSEAAHILLAPGPHTLRWLLTSHPFSTPEFTYETQLSRVRIHPISSIPLEQSLGLDPSWKIDQPAFWYAQSEVTHDGQSAIQTPLLPPEGTATLILRFALSTPATVKFWAKLSAGQLQVMKDKYPSNVPIFAITRTGDWAQYQMTVSPRWTRLAFQYRADLAEHTENIAEALWLDQFSVDVYKNANEDRDRDGMPDLWELDQFDSVAQNAQSDFDKDGASDLQEYLDGTSPINGSKFNPRISITVDGPGTVSVTGGSAKKFAPNQYSVLPNSTVTLTAVPSTEAHFSQWSGAVSGTSPSVSALVTSHMSIKSEFAESTDLGSAVGSLSELTLTSPGDHPWIIQRSAVYDGPTALMSGEPTSSGETSTLDATLSGPTTFFFRYRREDPPTGAPAELANRDQFQVIVSPTGDESTIVSSTDLSSAPPRSWEWLLLDIPPGPHTVHFQFIKGSGTSAGNAAVDTFRVGDLVMIHSIAVQADGKSVGMKLRGTSGRTASIYRSRDLISWTKFASVILPPAMADLFITDSYDPAKPQLFYSARIE